MILKFGKRELSLERPLVMGVVNVTPDSFSDGGEFATTDKAAEHALRMVEEGADIIDIGGESTRPGARAVATDEELDRVLPVIERVARDSDACISVDTSKPAVMRAAIGAGAGMVNDIFALQRDGAIDVAAGTDAAICLMHMQGTPDSMQDEPTYDDLPGDVIAFLAERVTAALGAGISRERLVVDPGFGFGKTTEHNLTILAELHQFTELGLPLLVGLSRKRTLGNLTGRAPQDRTAAGVAAAALAVAAGANIVRTHDVAETVDALKVAYAVNQARTGK